MPLTRNEIIDLGNNQHKNKYDYSLIPNKIFKKLEKILIICPLHGKFEQRIDIHLTGSECRICANQKSKQSVKITTEMFIEKAKKIHGNKYDYSFVNYTDTRVKVKIICPTHGEFLQRPHNHISSKQECPKCSKIKNIKNNSLTHDEFIKQSTTIHNNKFDYSKTKYIAQTNDQKIIIICPKHGEFLQLASSHIRGRGCDKCRGDNSFLSNQEFIIKANITHKNKYDYSLINYAGYNSYGEIICPIHGKFEQYIASHLQGSGCIKCSTKYSYKEDEVGDFLKTLKIENIQIKNRTILAGKELDFYLPDYDLAIEFNGLYWHSDVYRKDDYHIEKTNNCLKQNIQLIQIMEDEWIYKKEIVKSRIINILNKTKKSNIAYARKCFVNEISFKESKNFLEQHHIQGNSISSINLGLYIKINEKNYLLGVMTFGKLRTNLGHKESPKNHYELMRFCIAKNYSVIGGADKLLKYFERNFQPKYLLSYADRRWSIGNLYQKLNFELSHISKPNYFYVQQTKRINRFSYRKDILISKYGCEIEDTERNFTKEILKLNRIYDSGNYIFHKNY